jgi:hypothetical protein
VIPISPLMLAGLCEKACKEVTRRFASRHSIRT